MSQIKNFLNDKRPLNGLSRKSQNFSSVIFFLCFFVVCLVCVLSSLQVFIPPSIAYLLCSQSLNIDTHSYQPSSLLTRHLPLPPPLFLALVLAFTGGSQGTVCGCPHRTVVEHKPIVSPNLIIPALTADTLVSSSLSFTPYSL